MSTLFQDVRYGLRMLAKNPSFTVVVVVTLALGIGVNTAMFSVVNGVLFDPLPFPEADHLVAVHGSKPNFLRGSISYPNFLDWQKDNHCFSAMALYRGTGMSLTGLGEPERLRAEYITSDFFTILGVKPVIGRNLAQGEDGIGAAPTVLISEGLWQRKFGASRDVLGKTLSLDGRGLSVIGVVPASFHLDSVIAGAMDRDVYVPIGQWGNNALTVRGAGLGLHAIARLKPGVTIDQARSDMSVVTQSLAQVYPDNDRGLGATIDPLKESVTGRVRSILLVMLGAVGFVLLIACVNVANLLLARSAGRSQEFAIRAAMGAGNWRVMRQVLVETALMAFLGGALGLVMAAWGTHSALAALHVDLPRAWAVGVDAKVLLFTLGISIFAAILFGLAPALKITRPDLVETLKEGGRGGSGTRHRIQSAFVVVEMAMAFVLLIGAGLMLRTMARILNVNPGFEPHNVTTFSYAFPPALAGSSAETVRAACRQLNQKLASLPGTEAVSLSWAAFPLGNEDDENFWMEGQPKPPSAYEMNWTLTYVVEPGYLKAMGISLKHGRFFTEQDNPHSPPVVVVDEMFARKFFPDQDPIGKRIHLNNTDQLAEIVGVVGHVSQWGLDSDEANPLRAQLYHAFGQLDDAPMKLSASGIGVVIRSSVAPAALIGSIRKATGELSSDRVVWGFESMDEIISDSLASRRFSLMLLGAFAATALLLATLGIYGVLSYLVGQRTHEIAVRMALGAQKRDVLRLIVGEGMVLALAGVGFGLVGGLALTRFVSTLLYNVQPTDPLTFITVSILLAVVAVAACFIPARRAAKVDPLAGLRYQ